MQDKLLSRDDAHNIIETAISYGKGKADGFDVQVYGSNVSTSRFANNNMTQNQAPVSVTVSVRAVLGKRQARLYSDRITHSDIKQLIDDVVRVTSLLQEDEKLLPLLEPTKLSLPQTVDRFDSQLADATPDDRANHVREIINIAKENKLKAAGTVSTGETIVAVGNSKGVNQFFQGSRIGCSLTMCAKDSTGWAKASSPFAKNLDIRSMAERAAHKAVASADPVEIDPGHYTVILEPSAVLDLCGGLWYDFTGTSYEDKLSCFLNKLGKQALGRNITIYDDAYHPLQDGEPFDGEGMPRKKVCLVDKGVVKNLVYGRRSAKHFGVEPTGHGEPEPNSMGEYPENIVIEGGNTTLDDMIRTTDRGILLTRVWYVREVDPSSKIVTGMTRDGTFLIEHGKIKSGVKNLRFNESIIDMLSRVEALGPAVRAAGEETGPAVVPAMKVAFFNFESTTKF